MAYTVKGNSEICQSMHISGMKWTHTHTQTFFFFLLGGGKYLKTFFKKCSQYEKMHTTMHTFKRNHKENLFFLSFYSVPKQQGQTKTGGCVMDHQLWQMYV